MRKQVKDDLYRVEMIHFYIESILKFSKGKTYTNFKHDEQLNFAIVFAIGQIGEEANKLTTEFCMKHAHIPWKEIIAMRHKIVHDYQGMNMDIIWETVQHDIPELLEQCHQLLKEGNRVR